MTNRRIVFGAVLMASALACRTLDTLVAQPAPPESPARPTFTAQPLPASSPKPTSTRTRAPIARPTQLSPTAVPTSTTMPAATATEFPYIYHALFQKCTYDKDTYVKGTVYRNRNDSTSGIVGAIVILSQTIDGPAFRIVKSQETYTMIVRYGEPYATTFYAWVVDPSLKRISEPSPAIRFNAKGPDDPDACWGAIVDFWKEPGR